NFFNNGTVSIGGNNMSLVAANAIASEGYAHTAMWVLTGAPTGTQSLAWDWVGSSSSDFGAIIIASFYKNVDQSSPVRDFGNDGNQPGSSVATGTMTALEGDAGVAIAGADASDLTWTNATEISDGTSNGVRGAMAEAFPTGDTSITANAVSGDSIS